MTADASPAPLLAIRDLAVRFDGAGQARAVDGVSLTVHRGQTVAVVGESGCGKSVTALTVLRLIPSPPARVEGGSIRFEGHDLVAADARAMRRIRGGRIAMVFQEPMTALNPVLTVGEQVTEAIRIHDRVGRRAARRRAAEALGEVGIRAPERGLRAYPHEFSGGMRQRVMIAMALACRPRLLIADEPTTALDVTVQAGILDLLDDLRRRHHMGVLLISHDLGVVARHADVVCVVYAGRVVEYAETGALFARPLHPYTRALLGSIPRLRGRRPRLETVERLIEADGGRARLPRSDARPWWPAAGRPHDAVPDEHGRDGALVEVEPGRWVGCWRTMAIAGRRDRPPVIPPSS
ncbi:MAG: ATP-binding cassette domain-containing protein [Planctomycetota bacterium]|jgi:ABC-type dipeptide/oligopeptide/nickel transport system ATPase component